MHAGGLLGSALGAGADWGTIVGGAAAGATVSAILVRWVWKRFVNAVIEAIRRIEQQVTPNGGSQPNSIGTRIQALETEVTDTKRLVLEVLSKTGYIQGGKEP